MNNAWRLFLISVRNMSDYFIFGGTIFENPIENYGVSFPSQINPHWSAVDLPERLYYFRPLINKG
jgi:hypothetical protein